MLRSAPVLSAFVGNSGGTRLALPGRLPCPLRRHPFGPSGGTFAALSPVAGYPAGILPALSPIG